MLSRLLTIKEMSVIDDGAHLSSAQPIPRGDRIRDALQEGGPRAVSRSGAFPSDAGGAE
jgi:hypothetical protein